LKPLTTITDPRLVKALAHPLRLRILSVLEQREASPKELSLALDAPLTHVSYHVRQLAEHGIVKLVRRTPRRGAIEHHYRMDARPMISDEAWRAAPEIAKQAFVGSFLTRVSEEVNSAAAQAGFSRDGAHLSRMPLELDQPGWEEAGEVLKRLLEDLERIQADVRGRAKGNHGEERSAVMVITMLFEGTEAEVASQRAAHGSRKRTRSRSMK